MIVEKNDNNNMYIKRIIYVACPKSPVTHAFYSERIAGTNNSYSCRITGHSGTYFNV